VILLKKRSIAILVIIFVIFALYSQVYAQTVHTVKYGDTLWKIAEKYQVGLSEIKKANPQIKNYDLIYPGQKITIPDISSAQQLENEVIKLVNQERAKRGLQALQSDWQLSRAARFKSADMAEKGYFSHTSPTYGSPFQMMHDFQVRSFSAAGENIAYGQRTPQQVMNDWMNSPGHRSNILSSTYTHIGVGVAENKNGVKYWTQMFIKATK